jgi:hypothetical protein
MRTSKLTIALATAAIAGSGAGAVAASAPAAVTAATRHVEGRVTAVDRSARTFTVRDAERGTLKVKVTARTKFERIRFSSLGTGSRVDVRATRISGAWVATKVERGGIGANHDASANHDAGDDHGGRHGGGSDDPAGHH